MTVLNLLQITIKGAVPQTIEVVGSPDVTIQSGNALDVALRALDEGSAIIPGFSFAALAFESSNPHLTVVGTATGIRITAAVVAADETSVVAWDKP